MHNLVLGQGPWRVYGNSNPKIFIAGHSHTFAMYMALENEPAFKETFGVITHTNFEMQEPLGSDYWDYVVSTSLDRYTAVSWNGNQHNIHFLLDANLKFSALGFHENEGFPSVSLARIKDLFRPTFYELELILSRFTNLENVCLLGTPSPKSKNLLNQFLKKDQYFIDLGKKMNLDENSISVSDDDLRIFMWKITQELTAEVAVKFGCQFLATPKSTYDSKFLMLEKYSAPDLTHANVDFGTVMLTEIQRFYGMSHV